MTIWKDLLLQNKEGRYFKNAKTISAQDRDKKFQIFEVLVTETLAIVDPDTEWHSLPVQGDEGIDFIGEIRQIKTPYLISKPNEVVLGQIKRRSGSYTKDHFHYDIIKIIEYYNKQYSQKSALFEIIHVLSTDSKIDTSKWLENITYPYASYKVLPVNALDFLKFWKINPNFLRAELSEIYCEEQLQPLWDYIDSLQENWEDLIHISIITDTFTRVDDEINVKISFSTSVDLALPLIVEWTPSSEKNDIAIIYPTNILKNNISKYSISVFKNYDLTVRFKAIKSGKINMGKLYIYSSSGKMISFHELGNIDVHSGIANKFYSLPYAKQLPSILNTIKNCNSNKFMVYALIGQGGIGKSRLAQEVTLFAQNQKFYTISVQNSNDFINSRNLILDILMKMLNLKEMELISYENLYDMLRSKLGANFSEEWNVSVVNYILGFEVTDSDLEKIAKCILTVLIIQLHQQPVFIWLSDMHWASKETILLIQKLINLVKLNKEYLCSSLILLLEGRDSDTLKIEEKIIFPYQWLKFCESENVKKCKLSVWKKSHSLDFIRMLVNPFNKTETPDMQLLIELLMNYSSGNPMHIKELLRYMVENENVLIDENGSLTLVNSSLGNSFERGDLSEIILKRICFYHEKYPVIVDYYILLATISNNLHDVYCFIKTQLDKIYFSYDIIEKDIGIVSDINAEKIFLHEYYKALLKTQRIKNEKNIYRVLHFYCENCEDTIDGQLDRVLLQLALENPNFSIISNTLLGILRKDITDYQAMKCYEILSKIPQKYSNGRKMCEILFQMSEIAIRIGSWRDSQRYLERIIALKHETELEKLHYILACKNLGNIYGVGLELEKSLSICKKGIETVESILANSCFSDKAIQKEFERQYEMLLNRIAVTYWFAGQPDASEPFQADALESAKKRQDTYSIAHTLYETGMRQLHQDINIGSENIKQALELLPEKQKYTEVQERCLVEIEYLISKILLFTQNRNQNLLESIQKESEKICQKLSIGVVNYESAICHLVNAICYIFNENYDRALKQFFVGLDCANLGEFYTLRWKCYLNISETFLLLFEKTKDILYETQAKKYAAYGKKLLDEAIERNQTLESYIKLMEIPHYHFETILGNSVEFPSTLFEYQPIGIEYKKYHFYIMD